MKVGVLCEFSGVVRDAFLRRGHDAVSCDLLPTESEGPHIQGDCLEQDWSEFDLLICHPPCTYLAVSGLHWNNKQPERTAKTEKALEFVRQLLNLPTHRIALENPVSCISTRIRKPDQIIEPWMFGHDASKKTCLWLKNLPELRPTDIVENPAWVRCESCDDFICTLHGEHVADCKCPDIDTWAAKGIDPYTSGGRYANQTPSGQNKLGPSPDRWKKRSTTYRGIAEAMADQWSF